MMPKGAEAFLGYALFSLQKNFTDFSSHRILRHIQETLNIDKKITNYTVLLIYKTNFLNLISQ